MKTLRLLLPLWVLLTAAVGLHAEESTILRAEKGEVPTTVRTLEIDHAIGGVTVTGVAEGFGWEWSLTGARGKTTEVENYAQEFRLEPQESEGRLKLVLVTPEERRGGTRSDGFMKRFLSIVSLGTISSKDSEVRSKLSLRVPLATTVEIKNRFGPVNVSGTSGTVVVEAQNGEVNLADIGGMVTARTSFGALRADHLASGTLNNQNGNIHVRDIGGDLYATTSFGRLQVRDVKGHATLKNQNGAIEVRNISGDLKAETSFGDLLAEKIGGKADLKGQNSRIAANTVTGLVKASTSFGSLSVYGLGNGAELKNQNGNIDAQSVTGDVIASTSFGSLRVNEIGGIAELDCRNGKIVAESVTGNVHAKNSFAPVHVRKIGGSVQLEGQNSEIAASGVSGDIQARTSFARMQLEGNGRRFIAHNQNGAVDIIARGPDVQEIEASASFAPIQLQLPPHAKAFVRANTSFGKVYSSFPVYQAETVSDARFAAEPSPLKVSLKGQNGDIRIQEIDVR